MTPRSARPPSPSPPGQERMKKAGIIIGSVVVVAIAALAFLLWPRGTTAISRDQAVDQYRDREGSTTTARERTDGFTTTPAAGVYTFAATGEETAKVGPLPAQNHKVPATVTVVVVNDNDGCFTFSVNFYAEHTEETRYCVDGRALRLAHYTKRQTIGAITATVSMECDPNVIRPGTDPGSAPLSCTLTVSGGPFSVKTQLSGTSTTKAEEPLTIGADNVDVLPTETVLNASGSVTAAWTERIWWSPDNLPVRMEREFHTQGATTFDENPKLTLTSLTPSS